MSDQTDSGRRPRRESASARRQRIGLVPAPIVTALVKDPANVPQYFVLRGWVGAGSSAGVWRVYRTHTLDEYFELDEDDICWVNVIGDPEPDMIWVARGAKLRHVLLRAQSAELDFLTGTIADEAILEGRGDQGTVVVPQPTACPPCPTRSP
jgi:hypothetical protein